MLLIQRYYSAVIEVAHFSIINPWGIEHETKVKFIIFCVCDTFFDVLQQRQEQQLLAATTMGILNKHIHTHTHTDTDTTLLL